MAELIYNISAGVALLAFLLSFFRFLKGPSPADRIVALDVMTIIGIGLIVFLAATLGRRMYIDVALVYGFISFLGVVAVARYLEGGF